MIFLLISFLINVFGSGPEAIFIAPDVIKQIKINVEDKDNRSEILDIMKEAKKEIKTFRKNHKENSKHIGKLLSEQNVGSNEINHIFKKDSEQMFELQNFIIDERIRIQNILTDDEWNSILEEAIKPSEKKQKKEEKKNKKEREQLKELTEEIRKEIRETILDKEKNNKISIAFENFVKEFKDHLKFNQELTYTKNEILKDKNATKEMLLGIYIEQNKIRLKMHNSFNHFFDITKQNTTEDEWDDMKKDIKAFFK